MNVSRYIVVQAIKTRDNELIPLWDPRIRYNNSDYYGKLLSIEGNSQEYGNVEEVIYDLKTKTLSPGIEVDHYPEVLARKKGDKVLYEVSNRNLKEETIQDIVYEQYDLEIKRGKKMNQWEKNRLKGITIDPESIYAIRNWKPFYILSDGTKVEWEHQLYNKVI